MPTYQRIEGGRVVETVTPVAGDHEDTRLGVAALDRPHGADGWRDVAHPEPNAPAETVDAGGQALVADAPPKPKPKAPRATDTPEA